MARRVNKSPGNERTSSAVRIDGASLTIEQVCQIARQGGRVSLGPGVKKQVTAARKVVDDLLARGETAYGINTGFGHLARVKIDSADVRTLQINLIRSHAAGVGPDSCDATVRCLLLLRANTLARGNSGVRVAVLERLLDMLAADVLPVVPEQGSVGASGDLAPLAHVALALIGEGYVRHAGRRVRASRALESLDMRPVQLEAKEGLALVNGTQFSAAIGCLALERARHAARTADITAALSLEALKGTWRAFDPRIHRARPHKGQKNSADNMMRLMKGSAIWKSHAQCDAVQDAYSLRCAPQVHGAARDALDQLERILTIEINSSTDNPMVFANESEIVSGGNFHAAPLAAALDYATLSMATLASIVERRIDRLVNPLVSNLPAFLARDPGLESGLMMAHVTAASLVTECKTLAHPGSVDSIPTSANQEDHVSMAPWCARKLRDVVDRVELLLAIELLAAHQAIRFHAPLAPAPPLAALLTELARAVKIPRGDFPPSGIVQTLRDFLAEGRAVQICETAGCRIR